MHLIRYIATFVFLGVFFNGVQAQSELHVLKNIEVFVDSTNLLNIDQIQQLEFNPIKNNQHSGIFSPNRTWMKITIPDELYKKSELALIIDQANIDSIDLYQFVEGENHWEIISVGINYPFIERSYPTNHFILDINQQSAKTIYLRVRSQFQTSFNILLGERNEVLRYESSITVSFILILGIIIAMIGYNTFLYISIREPVYLIYVIQSSLTAILQVILFGMSMQYFWPINMWFQEYAMVFFTSISSLSGLVFMITFLRTKQHTPILHKISLGLIGFYVILSIITWFKPNLTHAVLLGFQPIIALFILTVAIFVIARGYRPARYYLLAWSMFLFGIMFFVLAEVGVIERSMFTILAIPFGAALEVVLLSLALANRINILKAEQEEAVSNSFRLEKEKATLIQEQNLVLEQKVIERTAQLKSINLELGEKNVEIENAYSDLKSAQSQLVNAEKMSSLGQLTAGIAHEINNPINFVSSNVSPLRRDVEDIIMLFEKTESLAKENISEEKYQQIIDLKEEIEYSYVIDEIDELLAGMKDGAFRTVEIINGLKLFSRIDEDDLKKVNLEEGIRATLVLLNSHLKHYVEVKTDFSNVPMVDCYGGKMNQVFMNILSNAIHAIKQTNKEDGLIHITTTYNDDKVTISIKDNGMGMSNEVQEKLFEPFYTTKPVGEGTGLGLSIVFSIIEKINGEIQVRSEEGIGTEFIITLPTTNTT